MRTATWTKTWTALALTALSLTWVACGDDSSDSSDSSKQDAGKGGRAARAGTGGTGGAGGKSGTGGTSGKASDDDAGTDKAGSAAPKDAGTSCEGDKGCYNCEPKEDLQFLNHCTAAECEPFDNAKRLPLYNGGDLPKLP